MFLFGIGFGSFKFISLWHFSLLCPQGYLVSFKGFYAFVLLAATLAGTLLLSAIIDQFHKYKKVYRFCFSIMTFGIGLFAWVRNLRFSIRSHMANPIISGSPKRRSKCDSFDCIIYHWILWDWFNGCWNGNVM